MPVAGRCLRDAVRGSVVPQPYAAARAQLTFTLQGRRPVVNSRPDIGGDRDCAAIVGAACRLPGGVSDLEGLSRALAECRDLVSTVPADRFDAARWVGADRSGPGLAYTAAGGFLDDISGFDASFFGISPREAAQLDPQQRLLLELTVEAFDHAGIDPSRLAGLDGGVFAGVSTRGYWELLAARPEVVDAHSMVGTITAHVANRVSFLLDWRGPSVAIDTACSSALVAVHQAARAVACGEVPIAVAAGVGLLLNPADYVGFSKAGLLSPSGRCRAFSADADGFVRAEGGGVIVLKRLRDAVADGDRVLGVIRGSGVNTDGRSAPGGLNQPSAVTQQALLERVYREAGVAADQLVYLECHGTGTPIGDPVECASIGAALGMRRRPGRVLPIGSVKTNLGHLECASGMAGLLKALVVLRDGRIPPSLHTRPLNPGIDFDHLNLVPVDAPTPVDCDGPEACVGVNSFGIGGANAHVIVSRPTSPERGVNRLGPTRPAGPVPVVVSGRTPGALAEAAWAMADHLLDTGGRAEVLSDVAYTSARRRRHEHAAVVMARDAVEAADRLYRVATAVPAPGSATGRTAPNGSKVAFVFSGNGSQWQGMARELLTSGVETREPAFVAKVEEVSAVLSPMLGWEVAGALRSGNYDLARTEVAQPLLFAIQLALVAALAERSVSPAMVAGHSVGEIAAAHVAGILDLPAACRVVAVRGAAQARTAGRGAMAAAAVDERTARSLIAPFDGRVVIGAVNSGCDVTLCGDADALREIGGRLTTEGVFFRMLPLDYAFHSALMDPIRGEVVRGLADVRSGRGALPLWSTVTGTVFDEASMGGEYWWRNVREPVLFASACEAMTQAGAGIMVEIGPHPVLQTYLRRLSGAAELVTLPVLTRRQPPDLDAVAAAVLVAAGPAALSGPARVVDLPAYPWQRERYWIGEASWWGGGPGDGVLVHSLLGERVPVPGAVWSGVAGPARTPWLADHRVGGAMVVPGAAFVELALAAGARSGLAGRVQVRNLSVTAALTLPDAVADQPCSTLATAVDDDVVTVSSRGGTAADLRTGSWLQHARGRVRTTAAQPPPAPAAVTARTGASGAPPMTGTDFYAMTSRAGTDYGPAFRALTSVEVTGHGEVLAAFDLPEAIAADLRRCPAPFHAHPVLLDVMVQAGGPLLPQVRSGSRLFVPVEFGTVTVWRPPPAKGLVHVRTLEENDREAVWDVTLTDDDGQVSITMERLRVRLIEGTGRAPIGAWKIDEQPHVPSPTASDTGPWAVAADAHGAELAAGIARLIGAATVIPAEPGWRLPDHVANLALIIHVDPGLSTVDDAARSGRIIRDLLLSTPGRALTIWVITGGGHRAAGASAWGAARTLANERAEHTVRRVAVSQDGPGVAEQIATLLTCAPDTEDEYILGSGEVSVPRVTPVVLRAPKPGPSAGSVPRPQADDQATVLRVRETAMAPRFGWEPISRPEPGPGQVLIEVRAAGLNYKDVMLATGLMPAEAAQRDRRGGHRGGSPLIGQECAGVVTAVGPGVHGLPAGRAVMAIAPGSLATHVVAEAAATVPVPDGLGFAEAATIPLVYSTALHALHNLADLGEGETLLLPAATGGVGLAALTLARRRGAHVIALAGSQAKRELALAYGARHAFDSRSLDFAEHVRAATGGRGVDVVLNSLTGAAAAAALELLAPDGRFIELGKRDLYADNSLRLQPFLHTLSYQALDLAQLITRRPATAARVLSQIADLAAAGDISPLPCRTLPATRLDEGIDALKRSAHTGKIVIDLAECPTPDPGHIGFDPDGGYLVTGGTRGFGAATARWLADHGAGHIVVTSRGAADLDPLPPACTILTADVCDRAAMTAAVQAAAQAPNGLKGVFHCAAHYDDAPLADLSPQRFTAVLAPKVTGAAILDELTQDANLDHFVLYSSIAALIGNRLQGAYSAANLCLEALAADRRRRGAPALSVGWGPIADLGVVARDDLTNSLTGLGLEPVSPHEALDTLGRILAAGRLDAPHVVIARADWQRLAAMFPTCTAARYQAVVAAGARGSDESLAQELQSTDGDKARDLIAKAITATLAEITKLDRERLDPDVPLDRLGVDSLLATELAVNLRRQLNIAVSTLEILSSRGITDLATRLSPAPHRTSH
jgi:phthiocerol/phenolphthiocerol synthesis type-I polyketide synthase C